MEDLTHSELLEEKKSKHICEKISLATKNVTKCIKKRDFGVQTDLTIDPNLLMNIKNEKKSVNISESFCLSTGEKAWSDDKERKNNFDFFNLIMQWGWEEYLKIMIS